MEDSQLVEKVLAGESEYFEILVRKYQIGVYKFLYKIVPDKEMCEDITQEVFITAYNKLNQYDSNKKFQNWILQIAKNKYIDYYRKNSKVVSIQFEHENILKDTSMTPEEVIQHKETIHEINLFIETLSAEEKQILQMRYKDKMKFTDMATKMEVNLSYVKRRFYSLKDNFKKFKDNQVGGVDNEM